MPMRGALAGVALLLGLASCSPAPRAVIRNATGADVLLWPLAERPSPLRAGVFGSFPPAPTGPAPL